MSRQTPAARRRQIAAAAAALFSEQDASEVSLDEIATSAGVSRSLVYKYFGDRRALLAAAYLHDLEMLDEHLMEALASSDSLEDRVRALVIAYLDFARVNRASSRLIASLSTLRHPSVQAAMEKRAERIAAQFLDDPAGIVIGQGIVGLLESASLYWVEHSSADAEEVSDLLFRLLWSGLGDIADELGLSLSGQRPLA